MTLLEGVLQRAHSLKPSMPMDNDWLSVLQTSELWSVHRSTIYRQLRAGTLPCRTLRIGGVWRINAADAHQVRDVADWIEADAALGLPDEC